MNDTQIVARRIREARKAQHLSLKELARLTGMYSPSLSEIERGKRNITILTLEKIATALKLDSHFFLKKSIVKKFVATPPADPGVIELTHTESFDFEWEQRLLSGKIKFRKFFIKLAGENFVRLMTLQADWNTDDQYAELVDDDVSVNYEQADSIEAWEPYRGYVIRTKEVGNGN